MFSMCSRATIPSTPTNNSSCSTSGNQVKGGYLLRYKRQLLWCRWVEEWVVLYDDSTMAWYTEEGRKCPSGKILVKEAPEMLAIANWTSQIPKRPSIPQGCSLSQLIAVGSRRKRSKVYWMVAKTEKEVAEWIAAITKTLPPAPQIELIVDKPHLSAVVRRPLVRIRPATTSEIAGRRSKKRTLDRGVNDDIRNDAAIAILTKNASATDSKGTLACALPWGHGWGWSTLPNGVWNGGLTWSQCDSHFTLHAMPTTHCTNLYDTASVAVCHADVGAGAYEMHSGVASAGMEDLGGDDFDYAMDCGDFIF